MPHQAPLQPGDPRRVGRYRLAGRITGIPADGPIFLGSGPDGAEVTISVLRSDWAVDPAARDRFAAEAAVAKRVPPFCAARILDAGLDGGDAYLVSEYVPGRSLLELVSVSGVLTAADVGRVAIGMATGLASVHQAGLVHGNFGPEYVIMTAQGPRVVEFGITPPYGAATPSADMLAWGQSVMFAAAGRPATVLADLDVLPGYLRDLVLECLSPDPAARPTARAAVTALIGQDRVPAGVLAEGSRRSVPGSQFVPPAARPAVTRPGPQPGGRGPAHAGRQAGHAPTQAGHAQAAHAAAHSAHGAARPGHGGTGRRPTPPGVPAGRSPAAAARPAAPPRRRRSALIGVLAAAAVVVIAAVGFGVSRLLGGHPSPHAVSDKSTRRGGLQTPSATPSASGGPATPATTATTPAGFAGAWAGEVQQPPNDTYHVALTLHQGSTSGQVRYQTAGVTPFSCTLNLMTAARQKLTFSEIGQGNCTAGTVVLRLRSGTAAAYTFNGGGFTATGTLTRP